LWHDPLYDQVTYNPELNKWMFDYFSPPRAFMNYAKPSQVCIRKWDPITDNWETLNIDEYDSYYRPIEFYDHYYSSEELECLKNKNEILEKQLKILKRVNEEQKKFTPYIYASQIYIIEEMLKNGTPFNDAMFLFIKENKCRIVKTIPFTPITHTVSTFPEKFNETWNTIDYFHMFLSKEKIHFVNAETCECNCKSFRKFKRCNHNEEFLVKRVLYSIFENIQLVIDLTPIIVNYL